MLNCRRLGRGGTAETVYRRITERPEPDDQWYTVCGKAHTDFPSFMLGIVLLGALGIAGYGSLLSDRIRPVSQPQRDD